MAKITIRIDDSLLRLAKEEAVETGVSLSQFIREATILRVGYSRALRRETIWPPEEMEMLLDVLRRHGG